MIGLFIYLCDHPGDLRKVLTESRTADEWLAVINGWDSKLQQEIPAKRYVSLNPLYTAAFEVYNLYFPFFALYFTHVTCLTS